jgi:hypothetical protein
MRRNIVGLFGTLLLWSGPFAFVAVVVLATGSSDVDRWAAKGIQIQLLVAMASPLTAPLGAFLRRGSRWTPAARLDRRERRSRETFSVFDSALLVGMILSVVFVVSLTSGGVRTSLRILAEWRDLSVDPTTFARVGGFVLVAATIVVFVATAVRVLWWLLAGFWARTCWGRPRVEVLSDNPVDVAFDPLPSRVTKAWAAGLIVLALCMVIIAGSIVYQLWIAPRSGPVYQPSFGSA